MEEQELDKKIPVKASPKDGKRWFYTILILSLIFFLGLLIAMFRNR